jgi:hypothetical protein
MLNPQDLNPVSVKRAENEVKDSIDLESQDDIKQTSFYIINELRKNLDVLEKKIESGALDGYQRPNLTARRIGILDVIRGVIEKMTNNIKGGYTIDHDKGKVVDDEPLTPVPAPDPDDLGYGYGATHHALDSVQTDSSKLINEVLPAALGTAARVGAAAVGGNLIKRQNDETEPAEDISSGMNHNAVDPDIQDDEQLIKAYYELVNSLNDRVEDMDETSKEIHIQTGKKDFPAITVQVLGFKNDPHTKAARQQEDATGALPPPDKIPGYESYMHHSTANPQRFG